MQIEEHIDYHRRHQFEGANKGKKKTEAIDLYQVDPTALEKIGVPDFLTTHL